MRKLLSFVALTLALGTPALLFGCGTTAVAVCEEAQEMQCTTIKGSCQALYDAIDALRGPTGCAFEIDAYEACVVDHAACEVDDECSVEQKAMINCGTPYCAANLNDANCKTVGSQF